MVDKTLYETINTNIAKMLVIDGVHIGQIEQFDYAEMKKQHELGRRVYVINLDGIFFFINNKLGDGIDYVKLRDYTTL